MSGVFGAYREGVRGVDPRVWIAVSTTLLGIAARMGLYTFLAIHFTQEVGFPIAVVGFAFLVENLARGLVGPVGGAISDRWGRRPVLVGATLATIVVLPLVLLVETPLHLVLWSIALGAAQAATWPVTAALLLDLAPPDRKQSVLSINYTAISIGYAAGVAPAGFVAALGFSWLVWASAAGFGAIALILLVGLRGPLPDTGAVARASLFADVSRAPRDGAFLRLAALGVVFPLGIGLITTVAPVFAKAAGLGEGAIGLALAVNGALLALFAIPVATRLNARGPYRDLAVSALLLAASYVAFVVGGTFGALVVASVVFTAGELIFGSSLPAAVAGLAPAGLRGAYQGAWAFVFSLGMGSALLLSGFLEVPLGWRATWLVWIGVTFAAAIGLALARPAFRRVADARGGV